MRVLRSTTLCIHNSHTLIYNEFGRIPHQASARKIEEEKMYEKNVHFLVDAKSLNFIDPLHVYYCCSFRADMPDVACFYQGTSLECQLLIENAYL